MARQNYEEKSERIRQAFERLRRDEPGRLERRLNLSWSVWMFGPEPLERALARLKSAGVEWVEIAGDHHTPDSGLDAAETARLLESQGMKAAGICGLFSAENDLSSQSPYSRQAAVDYLRREIDFARAVGAGYLLVVPGAVGRTHPLDAMEAKRSARTLRSLGDRFREAGIKAAIEPIRGAEVSFVRTIAEARAYLAEVGHPAIGHLNGDIFHMLSEEVHVGEAILEAGEQLVNLHLADSNRGALGDGMMDLDTVIRALYLAGHNREGRFVTGEPLGPGGDSYALMIEGPDPRRMDEMVRRSAACFREREEAVLGGEA